MTNSNSIKKKLAKEDKKVTVQEPSELLTKLFNGLVIKLNEEYSYDT